MGATAKWFLLMLGEKNDTLLPVYNRAIDVVGALRLAFMFSLIDDHLRKRDKFALKDNGQLRSSGGVALQVLKELPVADYIFSGLQRGRMDELDSHLSAEAHQLGIAPPYLAKAEDATIPRPPHLQSTPIPRVPTPIPSFTLPLSNRFSNWPSSSSQSDNDQTDPTHSIACPDSDCSLCVKLNALR